MSTAKAVVPEARFVLRPGDCVGIVNCSDGRGPEERETIGQLAAADDPSLRNTSSLYNRL